MTKKSEKSTLLSQYKIKYNHITIVDKNNCQTHCDYDYLTYQQFFLQIQTSRNNRVKSKQIITANIVQGQKIVLVLRKVMVLVLGISRLFASNYYLIFREQLWSQIIIMLLWLPFTGSEYHAPHTLLHLIIYIFLMKIVNQQVALTR